MTYRTLVVEDDADTAELLKDLFAPPDYECEDTPSGLDGLLRASKRPFDLILLDLDVRDLSGRAAQRALRDFSDTPTIVLSARQGDWTPDALRAGATACVRKPFGVGALRRLADELMAVGRSGPAWPPRDVRSLGPADLRKLRGMSKKRLDALPFGAIRLDRDGRIVAYNAYEATAAREETERVVGRRFSAIAPCVRVKAFAERAERARRGEGVDEVLRFVFPRHGSSSWVSLRLYAEAGQDELWIFVSQRPPA